MIHHPLFTLEPTDNLTSYECDSDPEPALHQHLRLAFTSKVSLLKSSTHSTFISIKVVVVYDYTYIWIIDNQYNMKIFYFLFWHSMKVILVLIISFCRCQFTSIIILVLIILIHCNTCLLTKLQRQQSFSASFILSFRDYLVALELCYDFVFCFNPSTIFPLILANFIGFLCFFPWFIIL